MINIDKISHPHWIYLLIEEKDKLHFKNRTIFGLEAMGLENEVSLLTHHCVIMEVRILILPEYPHCVIQTQASWWVLMCLQHVCSSD